MSINGAALGPARLCILFGSQATGRTHSRSDVDPALWPLPSRPSRTKLQWIVELEELLDKDISLVPVSPDTDPVLGMEIVRYSIVVFEAEPELWINKRLDL